MEHVDDIDDPSYYSIEDAKLKAENEKKMKAAEAKKQKVDHFTHTHYMIIL